MEDAAGEQFYLWNALESGSIDGLYTFLLVERKRTIFKSQGAKITRQISSFELFYIIYELWGQLYVPRCILSTFQIELSFEFPGEHNQRRSWAIIKRPSFWLPVFFQVQYKCLWSISFNFVAHPVSFCLWFQSSRRIFDCLNVWVYLLLKFFL